MIDKLIKDLVKNDIIPHTKIVKIVSDVYNDINGLPVIDGEPVDGGSIIKEIRLSPSQNNNIEYPKKDTYSIIIFINKYNAYIINNSSTEYIKNIISDKDGNAITTMEIKTENDKSIVDIETKDVIFRTHNGGSFTIIDDTVLISNTQRAKFQVIDDNKNVLNEIIIDADDGISLISYNDTPFELKNNITSLKIVLNDMIDKFANATYISAVGSAVVDPTSKTEILAYKNKINQILK